MARPLLTLRWMNPGRTTGKHRQTLRRPGTTGLSLVLLIAIPLLALGVASFVRRAGATAPTLGVEWVQSSAGPVAMSVVRDGAAAQAGLVDGDVLLAVDGVNVSSALDASRIGWETPAGEPIELRVQRGSSTLTYRIESNWQPRPEPYTYLAIVGLAFWVSGVFIGVRWLAVRGGPVYSALALSFFAQLTLSHTGRADTLDWFISWIDLLAGALAPALLVHLGLVLSRRSVRRRFPALVLIYAVSAVSVIFALWLRPEGAGGAYLFAEPLAVVELRESFEPLWLSVAWLITIGMMLRSYGRSSSVTHRSQMRWMLWGLAGGLGPFVAALRGALGARRSGTARTGPVSSRSPRSSSSRRLSPRHWPATDCTTWI